MPGAGVAPRRAGLIGALDSDAVPVTDSAASRVDQLGPRSVSRSVLLRIGNLGSDVACLAAAAAVLGNDAPLRQAAAVAGLAPDDVARAADTLAKVDILERNRPLRFIHPPYHRATQRNPTWPVDVSSVSLWRAAGR